MEQLAFGLRQAAEALGLSHWTLRAWVRQGKVQAVRLGRRVLIEPSELQRLIEQGRGGIGWQHPGRGGIEGARVPDPFDAAPPPDESHDVEGRPAGRLVEVEDAVDASGLRLRRYLLRSPG